MTKCKTAEGERGAAVYSKHAEDRKLAVVSLESWKQPHNLFQNYFCYLYLLTMWVILINDSVNQNEVHMFCVYCYL